MGEAVAAKGFEKTSIRARLSELADWLAVSVAVLLPWSTSAMLIAAALWLAALLPTLDRAALQRVACVPAAVLPVALVGLAALDMLWSDAAWSERIQGLGVFYKLLLIPLLMIQFSRSPRGPWVLGGFLVSCTALPVFSWLVLLWPSLAFKEPFQYEPGVPVRDRLAQSAEFVICIFALVHLAISAWVRQRHAAAFLLAAGALLFGLNLAFGSTSRTALVVLPLLLLLIGAQRFGWRGAVGASVIAAVLGIGAWSSSPYLQERAASAWTESKQSVIEKNETSLGFRFEFWRTALHLAAELPVIGHGTGSIAGLFREVGQRAASGETYVTDNPHNQTLLVALQLGLIGVAALWAMWASHLMLFRGGGLADWIGFGLVFQNVVSSLANSHLADFAPGWLYVIGVGVLGGIIQRVGTGGDLSSKPQDEGLDGPTQL